MQEWRAHSGRGNSAEPCVHWGSTEGHRCWKWVLRNGGGNLRLGPQGTAYEWLYLLQTAFIDNKLKRKINQEYDFSALRTRTVLSVQSA